MTGKTPSRARHLAAATVPWLVVSALLLSACVADTGASSESQAIREQWNPTAVAEGNLRVVSFNIRNFPEMPVDPEAEPRPAPLSYQLRTDEEALLQVLTQLDFDVMAVQEIIDVALFEDVIARLSERTGRAYVAVLSENANDNPQHLGVVIDSDKMRLVWTREHPEIDVRGTLRPGLSARIESLYEGGIDFGLMVLHLASGSSANRAILRAEQVAVAAGIIAEQQAELGDNDYLVLGDLNTARQGEEYGLMDESFAAGAAMDRMPNQSGCSSYWIKKATNPMLRVSWLDHVYLAALDELDATVPILSGAHCAERLCQPFESTDLASGSTFYNVSDHCPVYFEITDTDLDGPDGASA
jgi:endonuclease/exonuclease/phosphatase family metal-dependent hydrolase